MTRLGFVLALSGITGLATACASTQRPDGGEGMLQRGAPVPALSGTDQNGVKHSLAELGARPAVVYFYPKDATPGCTKEACAFRDAWDKYQAANVAVFGVSNDDRASHAEFASEHHLPFPLIDDSSGDWAKAFGVKSTLGFYSRVSFLIANGKVAKVYPDVDPGVHAAQVLADAAALKR